MTLKERIDEILALEKNQCWYITKQNLKFSNLCIAASILEKFKNENEGYNFQNFFNKEIIDNSYKLPLNHRFTNNCKYVGLLTSDLNQYAKNDLTIAYFNIKDKCNADFDNENLYKNEKIDQIEKLVISHPVDNEKNRLRDNYELHPTIYLYKILVSIGILTRKNEISLEEFKKFVGTSKNYYYYQTTIELIKEDRNPSSSYKTDLEKIKEKKPHFDGNRYNLLFSNLPYLSINSKSISITKGCLKVVTDKVNFYEKIYSEKFDHWKTPEFQNSSESIFNIY